MESQGECQALNHEDGFAPPQVDVGALPGECILDRALLDACAERVGRIYVRKCLEATLEACEDVVNTFFDGDLETFRARSKRHVTFKRLCEHPRVRRSVGAMSRLLGVYVQVREMDVTLARHLSVAHHQVLLPVVSVGEKNRLARRAVDEQLGKREFAAMARRVIDAQTSRSRGGRVPAPPLLKVVNATKAAFREMPEMTTSAMLPKLSPEQQLTVAEDMERLGRQLLAMAGHVRNQVDLHKQRPGRW